MDWQTLVSLVIVVLLSSVLFARRKELQFQGKFPWFYVGLLKTQLGLRMMNWTARRCGRVIRWFGYAGIVTGYVGMLAITAFLVWHTLRLFVDPSAGSAFQLVLPIKTKGVFYVPFLFWILTIFIIAALHEFSHGVVARAWNIKVKSSGFAFLGIGIPVIPAAFVEPDERVLTKRPKMQQTAVFAAGPFANILLAAVLILLLGIPLPFVPSSVTEHAKVFDLPAFSSSLVTVDGIKISDIMPNSPAQNAGLMEGMTVTHLNNVSTTDLAGLNTVFASLTPGQELEVHTTESTHILTLGRNTEHPDVGYMGIIYEVIQRTSDNALDTWGIFGTEALLFATRLVMWIIVLSLGIGLFNLLPLGPVDGGRMMLAGLLHFFSEKRAVRVWKRVSLVFLALLIVNLVMGFLL